MKVTGRSRTRACQVRRDGLDGRGRSLTRPSFLLCPCAHKCRKEPRGTLDQAPRPGQHVDSMGFVSSHGRKGHPGEVVGRKASPDESDLGPGGVGQERPAATGPGPGERSAGGVL